MNGPMFAPADATARQRRRADEAEAARANPTVTKLQLQLRAVGVLVGAQRMKHARRLAELRAMGQKELQETFRAAFRRATTSNNNQWLRRRIAGAMGLERLVGGASHAGAAGARVCRKRAISEAVG